jgi:hypothetical protein
MNINYTILHLLRAVQIVSGLESFSLMNLHLPQQMMGWF